MRNVAIVLGLTAITTSATAADMPLKAQPRPAPAFSWTGCYVGGYVGGAWSHDATFTDQGQLPGGNPAFKSFSGGVIASKQVSPHSWDAGLQSSAIGGGTLGCNWQPIGSPFVLGLEGEAGIMRLRGHAFDPNTTAVDASDIFDIKVQSTPDVLGSAKVGDWYGMATGRLGYAWDRTLIYIKGGAAFVPTRSAVVDACQNTAIGCGNWLISTGASHTVTTWTLGGGIEWAFAPNWSVKGEYMFIALGDDGGFQTCGDVTNPQGAIVAGGPFCFNHSFSGIHTAKIGLNYRFGAGPIVARY
jgi:outer membrane immunogenic protein